MKNLLHHWTERAWSSQRRPPWPLWSQNALPEETKTQELRGSPHVKARSTDTNKELLYTFIKHLFTWLRR